MDWKNSLYTLKTSNKYILFFLVQILFTYNVHSQYCISSPNNILNSQCDIVQLVGNSITLNKNTASICASYSNFTTGENIPDLEVNSLYTINITQGTCGDTDNRTANAWIDYNNNGDFGDANEMLGAGTFISNTNGYVHSYTFTVPAGALVGNTRMRVIVKKGGASTTDSCINNYSSGETEDYTVGIIGNVLSTPTFNNHIGIYPNPTENQISISGDSGELEIVNIYNVLGENVTSNVLFVENNEQKKILDLSKLSSGMYLVRTKTATNKVYKK
ncbi:GEVED domain-containing protein [Lacinutrix jangbogonensis]|uniref:GEVED domain-containing protein n=1 Tax=Lacinutrix jangbogonensis TaxID=1469557 RepID=UPI00053EFF36|nr:GEVED domain-containing protein [Lacinutrix jangbogonensis]